ncbi:MAG: hypothetical protein BWY99_01896 [Synergistetes bacterium ADurb.BinA166]|nr:MAG: hypothetical protein BWY99_01896 [Synergistetes bacterium ADurb.BinA166]
MLADGHVSKNTLRVRLATRDKPHLEALSEVLGYNGPVRDCKPDKKGHKASLLLICSKTLTGSLLSNGWEEFKKGTSVRILERIPREFQSHAARGLFDGDGCVSKRASGQFSIHFVDRHRAPVEWFCEHIEARTGQTLKVSARENIFYTAAMGNRKLSEILSLLYSRGPSLLRKRALVEELLSSKKSLRVCKKLSKNEDSVQRALQLNGAERVRLLYEAGCSQPEISRMLSVSTQSVWRMMRRHKIEVRQYTPPDPREIYAPPSPAS